MDDKIDYRKWVSYVIYADPEKQQKIIKRLKPFVEMHPHYNFNHYSDHVSIRLSRGGNYELEQKIKKLRYKYKIQSYDYGGRRSYELGTRAAFTYMMDKGYYDRDHNGKGLDLVEVVHGFLDNMCIGDKSEARLHRKMWWHFAVRKPYYRLKKRIRCFFGFHKWKFECHGCRHDIYTCEKCGKKSMVGNYTPTTI